MTPDELDWMRQRAQQPWASTSAGQAAYQAAHERAQAPASDPVEATTRVRTRRELRIQRMSMVGALVIGVALGISGTLLGSSRTGADNNLIIPGMRPLSGDLIETSPGGPDLVVCVNADGTTRARALDVGQELTPTTALRACPPKDTPGERTYAVCTTKPYLLRETTNDRSDACQHEPVALLRVDPQALATGAETPSSAQ